MDVDGGFNAYGENSITSIAIFWATSTRTLSLSAAQGKRERQRVICIARGMVGFHAD